MFKILFPGGILLYILPMLISSFLRTPFGLVPARSQGPRLIRNPVTGVFENNIPSK
jgi:hypothetical protein